MDAILASSSAARSAVDQFVEILLSAPPVQTQQMHIMLPVLVERLVNKIAEIRNSEGLQRLSTRRLRVMLAEINSGLLQAAQRLEELHDYVVTEPWVVQMLYGPTGIIGPEPTDYRRIGYLREHAGRAADWRKAVAGSGRHSLAERLGWPTPELLCAAGVVQLRQMLRWQREQASKERLCTLAEQLWLAAGGEPSPSLGRWLSYLAIAQGHKRARVEAIRTIRTQIERLLGPAAQGEILEEVRKQTRNQKRL
jgi:hypothetical protein